MENDAVPEEIQSILMKVGKESGRIGLRRGRHADQPHRERKERPYLFHQRRVAPQVSG